MCSTIHLNMHYVEAGVRPYITLNLGTLCSTIHLNTAVCITCRLASSRPIFIHCLPRAPPAFSTLPSYLSIAPHCFPAFPNLPLTVPSHSARRMNGRSPNTWGQAPPLVTAGVSYGTTRRRVVKRLEAFLRNGFRFIKITERRLRNRWCT